MSYWNKRPEKRWLPAYWCTKLQVNMIIRPKWCRENDKRHCETCRFKDKKTENDVKKEKE